MFREVIPTRRTVRDGGLVLLIASAAAAFLAMRAGVESGLPLLALLWVPLLGPLLFGLFLASARVVSDIDDGELRIQLTPSSSRQIALRDIVSVDAVEQVALTGAWRLSRDSKAYAIAPPFDKGPGVRIVTRNGEVYGVRSNRASELCQVVEAA